MLYVQTRFLFIHIPRSGGMSIGSTLVRHYASAEPCCTLLHSTALTRPWHQHATAEECKALINEWTRLYVFAVYRPTTDIIASDYRLHRAASNAIAANEEPEFMESIRASQAETLEQFRVRRWDPWLNGKDAWNHWTDGIPGVHRLRFSHLQEDFSSTLKALRLPPLELIRCNSTL